MFCIESKMEYRAQRAGEWARDGKVRAHPSTIELVTTIIFFIALGLIGLLSILFG